MPAFEVTTPDGKSFEVNVPEGATEQDAIAYIANTYKPEAPDEGGSLVDLPVGFARGAVQGVRFIADAFGAENPASKTLKEVEGYLGGLMSAQSQKNAEKISAILAEAEDKGMYEQVMSGLEALAVAPVDMIVQAFGTSAPMLVGGLLGAGLRTAAVIGGGMGAGVTKDAIYQATKDELIKNGVSKDEAEQRAQLAQEYDGKNLDQILLGTGLGAISGFTGIEKALLPSVIKNITDKAVKKSAIANIGKVAVGEAAPEFLQGGQEQVAQNVALQREGFDVPTFRGALGSATFEGLIGGGLGAGIGAIAPRGRQAPPEQEQAFVPPPAVTEPTSSPEEDAAAVQQFVDQRYPAPPTVAPPTPPAPVSLEDARLQKQKQAARQFGLGAPVLDASQAFQTGAQAPVTAPLSDTTIPFPRIQAPPSGLTQESFAAPTPEESRIEKQQQAQAQFGLDKPIGAPVSKQVIEPITAPISPSQVPVRQPRNLTEQDRQAASLRVEQLGRQLDQATTDFDRQNIRTQIDQALGVVESTPQPKFVDLRPMSIQQATNRLDALRGEISDSGGNALNLNVVPHPSTPNAFAIEQRGLDFDLDLPAPPPISGREAQQRIESSAMAGDIAQRGGEEEARQVIVSRALQSIQDRGGVASPAEAQIIREANLGQPYDRIDPSLAPQGTVDQRLSGATGIELTNRPREDVYGEPRRERENLDDLIAETNRPAPLPNPANVMDALKTPSFARTADQVSTLGIANKRYSPSDMVVMGKSAANEPMTGDETTRLNNIEQKGGRFDLSDNFSPEATAAVADIKKQLQPALKRLGLNNVGIKLVDSINNGDANGFYLKQVITIALDSDNPMGVMRHETIHALKELGAFTNAEWSALTKRAKAEWIDRFIGKDLTKRYQDVYSEQNDGDMSGFDEYIQEEAIAEAFRYFTEEKPPAGMIQNIISRLNKMFAAIKDFFSGKGLTPEDVFLTNAIFGSVESGRLTPGRGTPAGQQAPAFSLNSKIQQAAQEVGLSEAELNATSLPLQTGKVGKDRFNTPKTGLLTNTIKYLEDRRIESGVPILDVMKDEDHPLIAKLITAEAMAAIRTGGSALDWYDGVITRTINMAMLKHPELATDKNANTAFKLAMAITSQGLNVEDNIKLADQVYNSYKTSNKFPLTGSGGSAPVMKTSFKFANKLIDGMGMDNFSDFLGQDYSVRDLEAAIGKKISGELKDEMVLGSAVFGPKIGLGFYSNLNGNFEPVTMDMWFMRMIGRLTGNLRSFDSKKVEAQVERLRNALKETGSDGIYANQFDKALVKKANSNLDSAFELAKLVNSAHEKDFKNNRALYDSKERVKSELVSSAGTILKSLNKPIDSPSSGGQRRKLRQIFSQVRNNVAQLYGKDIQPAALQALVWYPEQSLYESLGVKLRVTNQDYAGAMRNLLLREGFNEQRIVTAAQRGSGSVQRADLGDVERADQSGGRESGKAVRQGKFSLRPDQFAFRPSDSGRDGISFRPRQPDAKSFVGSHYGNAKVNTLAGNKYGSGLKGAEKRRLDQSNDPRIKNRVYFYIPRFNDSMPPKESGVGNFVYSQKFDNMLAPGAVMSELFKRAQYDANAFESAIIDAGYDGYVNTDAGMMVILNNDVPVKYEGTVAEVSGKAAPAKAEARYSLRPLKAEERRQLESDPFDAMQVKNHDAALVAFNALPTALKSKIDAAKIAGRKASDAFKDPTTGNSAVRSLYTRAQNQARQALQNHFGRELSADELSLYLTDFQANIDESLGITSSQERTKFSLRATESKPFKRWFGNSKIVNPDGTPNVMYHGTARDITEFRPKQAGAIFVTDDPRFAENFAYSSEEYMKKNAAEFITPEIEQKLRKQAKQIANKERTDETDVYNELIQNYMPTRANIMPVFVRAENPFDYNNPIHIERLRESFGADAQIMQDIRVGDWSTIESEDVQAVIKDEGFDGFYVKEGGKKNLALYSPNQVKSATGNSGTFSRDSDDIRYNLAESPNAPPQVLTKTTTKATAGKAIVDTALETMSDFKDNSYWEAKRINWVDRYSGLTTSLKKLPIFQADGVLRADMIKHAQSNVINTVKTGIVSGVPFVANDGTIAIQPSENNLARSEFLADSLSINKHVVQAGMTGKNYVAEIARALRGEDILTEDKARNALGVKQLKEAKDLYAEIKKINATGGDLKLVKGYLRMIANLRKEGYKNKKMNRERQVTPDQIRWAKEQLTKVPQVQEILDIWKSINNSLIDLWQETGLLTPDAAAEYRNNKNYVPLFKAREDLEDTITRYGAGLKSPASVKQLKGSLAVRNIWENVDKQYAAMLVAAYENQSRRIAFEQLQGLGGAEEAKFKTDERVNLRFKRDGRDINAIVDNPNVLVAFQTFSKELTPIMKFMGFGTQVLRAGALINPMFWIKQLIRDPIHATLTSNSGIVTPLHAGAEFFNVLLKNSAEARFLTTRGVIGQIDSTVSLNDFLKNVGRDKLSDPNFIQKALHKLLEIHESSDAATRVAVFKKAKAKALKDGMSEEAAVEFAVYKAREVINFGVSGAHPFLNSARQMIPFLNATIVGLDSLYKAASGYGLSGAERKEAMRVFRTNASVFFVMSAAYAFMMQYDDDYKKLPDYVKDNNFLIPIGLGEGKSFVKLPIPYEVGFLFKTVPEVMVRYVRGTSSGKEVLLSYLGGLLHNLPTGGVPIPQTVRPALEVITNFSFFTMRPIEGMGDIYKPVEMRGDRASEFSKILSSMGLSKLSLSPKQIDYLSRGYFAELGTFSSEMADYAIYAARGESPPPKNLEQQPFMRSFMTNPEASKAVADFYEISGTAQQTVNGFNELKQSGSEADISKYLGDEKKAMTIAAAPTLRRIGGKMAEIKKSMQQIKDSDMPSEEKLRLHNELFGVFKTLAEQGVGIAKELGIR